MAVAARSVPLADTDIHDLSIRLISAALQKGTHLRGRVSFNCNLHHYSLWKRDEKEFWKLNLW